MESVLTKNQEKTYISGGVKVTIRYDDRCNNGHNTFGITGEVFEGPHRGDSGCVHEDIVRAFPEFEHLIRWHLCSSNGPLHYLANTLYFAGTDDCWHNKNKKERELDYARKSAIWPEATDEELMADDLKEKLIARLPELMERFRKVIESLGFVY